MSSSTDDRSSAASRLSVLLVEADEAGVHLVRAMLGPCHPSLFRHAARVDEAVRLIHESAPEVILLSLSLPDATGIDAVTWISSNTRRAAIIVLTGEDDEEIGRLAIRLGAQDYLSKSDLAPGLLARTVRHAVERVRLAEELDRLRREQRETRDRFLSHVSHELRTPLNAAYQFVSIMLDDIAGPISSQQREYLEIVSRNVEQLKSMIGDLLEANRLDSGDFRCDPQPADIGVMIRDVVAALSTAAANKRLKLEIDLPERLPAAFVDPGGFRQVVVSLLDNAIKFTPEMGTIGIRAEHCRDAVSEALRVTVRDSGCGVPAELKDRIFERMAQEDGASDVSRNGLGLGLYICRELVTRQGGRIWVESERGGGSAFSFTSPVAGPSTLARATSRRCADECTPNVSG